MNYSDEFSGLPLWDGPAPFADPVADAKPEKFEIAADGLCRVTDVSEPTLDFYAATTPGSQPCPAVVVCPGGGYSILSVYQEGRDIARWLAQFGISAFLLKYRCPGRREAALADAARAIRLVRANAAKWRIDPAKVGIIGFSAGAHLLSRLSCLPAGAEPYPRTDAVDDLPCRPDFQMPIYPAYIFRDGYAIDPDFAITKDTPPAFIAQSANDTLADSAFAYAIALRNAGVPVELHIYPDGGHGYGMLHFKGRAARAWARAAEDWLAALLRGGE